jgi:hypothetical protein
MGASIEIFVTIDFLLLEQSILTIMTNNFHCWNNLYCWNSLFSLMEQLIFSAETINIHFWDV